MFYDTPYIVQKSLLTLEFITPMHLMLFYNDFKY